MRCSTTDWMNKKVPLILDHINGDWQNEKLDNLRLICPNCDHQTETFSGRNKGRGREYRREKYKLNKTRVYH